MAEGRGGFEMMRVYRALKFGYGFNVSGYLVCRLIACSYIMLWTRRWNSSQLGYANLSGSSCHNQSVFSKTFICSIECLHTKFFVFHMLAACRFPISVLVTLCR